VARGAGTAGSRVSVRLALTGRLGVLPLPRDSVRVQQFSELARLARHRGQM
jgi:hypothetical protein